MVEGAADDHGPGLTLNEFVARTVLRKYLEAQQNLLLSDINILPLLCPMVLGPRARR